MSHESTLLLVGIIVILSPFLGLPYSWLMVIVPVLGVAIVALSVILRARVMMRVPQVQETTAPSPVFDESTSVVA
jgi:hypothetical protein